ncbi:hypothetical protein PGTUg99_033978 [Puccinia graminis f. sp. tritici]|uniref:Uncharacterized protein n=2 Tax=Puccinia graminis f. sp. tritici TaxID=56615 RepID=A0A5B0Q8T1_PUCGR|nr:hypothetical protein PGTUg99_033978 [Puccinia graminis f. sp. tritici]
MSAWIRKPFAMILLFNSAAMGNLFRDSVEPLRHTAPESATSVCPDRLQASSAQLMSNPENVKIPNKDGLMELDHLRFTPGAGNGEVPTSSSGFFERGYVDEKDASKSIEDNRNSGIQGDSSDMNLASRHSILANAEGRERKRLKATSENYGNQAKSSTTPVPLQIKPIKLMGFYIFPEGEPPSSDSMTRKIDEERSSQIDLDKQDEPIHVYENTDTISSIPTRIPLKHPINLTLNLLEESINPRNCLPGRKRHREKDDESGKIKFDSAVFDHSMYSKKFQEELLVYPFLTYDGVELAELVMSENQFLEFQKTYHLVNISPEGPTVDGLIYRDRRKFDELARKNLRESACEVLVEDREVWYNHWKKITNLEIRDFIENLICSRPNKIRNTIVTFLFYVEMISTIIPDPNLNREEINESSLIKAFQIAIQMFGLMFGF